MALGVRESFGASLVATGILGVLFEGFDGPLERRVLPSVLTMIGVGLLCWASFDKKTDHRPAVPAHEQYDPMRDKKGRHVF